MAVQQTLAMIKPDAMEKGIVGEIVKRMEDASLKPIAMKMHLLTKKKAEGFYAVHRGKPFFEALTTFMSSGPSLAIVLEGENAIATWREVMGATDPEKAADGSIRKDFGTNIERNAVHGSDSSETAAFEISYFFDHNELVKYEWM